MDTSGYKQTEEGEEDMGNTVFGREHDSMELMARFGCPGYMQKFYDFLQGKFHPALSIGLPEKNMDIIVKTAAPTDSCKYMNQQEDYEEGGIFSCQHYLKRGR
ncbi:MAG: hypothetical protein HFH12_15595 [Dorea sp.]|nr:hypothetical protein [Dorea sp.]